jgi:hypothetical protein
MTLASASATPATLQTVNQVLSNAAPANVPYLLGIELTTPLSAPLGMQTFYQYYDSGTNEWKVTYSFRNFSAVVHSNVSWNIYYYNI